VLELVVTKLPHYVLPIYPAIAILLAGSLDARTLSIKRWLTNGTIWWFLIPLISGIAGLIILFIFSRQFGLLVWPAVGAAVVMGLLAWRLYEADGAEHSLLRATVTSLVLSMALVGLVAPALTPVFPSMTLAKLLNESGCSEPLVASSGYHEPSLVFLTGTGLRHTTGEGAAEFLREGGCRFAFVEARQERAFAQRAEALGLRYNRATRVDGINISGGRPITVSVFRPEPNP